MKINNYFENYFFDLYEISSTRNDIRIIIISKIRKNLMKLLFKTNFHFLKTK